MWQTLLCPKERRASARIKKLAFEAYRQTKLQSIPIVIWNKYPNQENP